MERERKRKRKRRRERAAWCQIRFICLASHWTQLFFFPSQPAHPARVQPTKNSAFAPPSACHLGRYDSGLSSYRSALGPIRATAMAVWDPQFSGLLWGIFYFSCRAARWNISATKISLSPAPFSLVGLEMPSASSLFRRGAR